MEPPLQSLFPLISRRFQSFAEATDAALDVLTDQIPGEILIGQIEPDDDRLRVLDVRGASIIGIERGHLLPLTKVQPTGGRGPAASVLEGTNGIDDLDAAHLRALGLGEWIALPLEMSDGAVVGIAAALSRRQGDYRAEHVVLLGLAARMLAYEWERVQTRNEMRRLRQRADQMSGADADTGLPSHDRFLDLIDREWKLSRRGTVESSVVVFQITAGDEPAGSHLAVLALKDAAEALSGAARSTDQVGRVGEMELGAVMIGCTDEAGVEALAQRFEHALRRVSHGRPFEVSISHRWTPLADTQSPAEALENAARATEGERIAAANGSLA